jgi:hypothetical protein
MAFDWIWAIGGFGSKFRLFASPHGAGKLVTEPAYYPQSYPRRVKALRD